MLGLKPRLDNEGQIRNEGRLRYAEFPSEDTRFPIILLHNNQVQSQLSLRAFVQTAVDFGDPFITIQGRELRRQKHYLCLFTCLATRTVHREMAYDLDTDSDSFFNAFYRMTNQSRFPRKMVSDNHGETFVEANKELRQLLEMLDQDRIRASAANHGVTWHFNPPAAPPFGGVYETMIKATKRAVHEIFDNVDIIDEELMIAFTGAADLFNSRPLTYQSASPCNDDVPLTPNHFLIGQISGRFAPESELSRRDHLQPKEKIEKSTRISQALLAQMAASVASKSKCQEKVD